MWRWEIRPGVFSRQVIPSWNWAYILHSVAYLTLFCMTSFPIVLHSHESKEIESSMGGQNSSGSGQGAGRLSATLALAVVLLVLVTIFGASYMLSDPTNTRRTYSYYTTWLSTKGDDRTSVETIEHLGGDPGWGKAFDNRGALFFDGTCHTKMHHSIYTCLLGDKDAIFPRDSWILCSRCLVVGI